MKKLKTRELTSTVALRFPGYGFYEVTRDELRKLICELEIKHALGDVGLAEQILATLISHTMEITPSLWGSESEVRQ
jgi:hypothetical protein